MGDGGLRAVGMDDVLYCHYVVTHHEGGVTPCIAALIIFRCPQTCIDVQIVRRRQRRVNFSFWPRTDHFRSTPI